MIIHKTGKIKYANLSAYFSEKYKNEGCHMINLVAKKYANKITDINKTVAINKDLIH